MQWDYREVDIVQLEQMGEVLSAVLHNSPEMFFLGPEVYDGLIEPIETLAQNLFGSWACRVCTSMCLGISFDGAKETITDANSTEFIGRFTQVDLMFEQDADSGLLLPSLVFDTLDDPQYDRALAQTYPFVGLPLIENVTSIEKVALAE